MPSLSPFDQITERVELLLAHHADLQRSNALLAQQVAALAMERDSLKTRLLAARNRIDALVDRLKAAPACESTGAAPEDGPAPAAAQPAVVALQAAPAGTSPLPPKEERP